MAPRKPTTQIDTPGVGIYGTLEDKHDELHLDGVCIGDGDVKGCDVRRGWAGTPLESNRTKRR